MNNTEQMIKSQDAALSELRREWKSAPAKEKENWMVKINQALDVRLQMMKQRDSTPKG